MRIENCKGIVRYWYITPISAILLLSPRTRRIDQYRLALVRNTASEFFVSRSLFIENLLAEQCQKLSNHNSKGVSMLDGIRAGIAVAILGRNATTESRDCIF